MCLQRGLNIRTKNSPIVVEIDTCFWVFQDESSLFEVTGDT